MSNAIIVTGPPCSGKSTYVKDHIGENDVCFDFDLVCSALTMRDPHYDCSEGQAKTIFRIRNFIAFLSNEEECAFDTAFIIATKLTDNLHESLPDAEIVQIEATEEECYERLENDESRPDKERERKKIYKYFHGKEEKSEMDMKKEFRSFQFEVRAEESEQYGKHLEGMPIVFDAETNLGDFMEEISRGALDHTDLKDVRFLVNHNTDMIPLARSRNNNENSTMQMKVEEEGMKIRVNLDTENNADARALYSAVQRGDISGMSFMFTVDEDRWEGLDTEMPKRYITSIAKVFEVSAVSFPAYEQTSIAARSQIDALESAKKALESERLEARKADLWEIFRNNLEEVRSHGN